MPRPQLKLNKRVVTAYELADAGESHRTIAEQVGVSRSAVGLWMKNKRLLAEWRALRVVEGAKHQLGSRPGGVSQTITVSEGDSDSGLVVHVENRARLSPAEHPAAIEATEAILGPPVPASEPGDPEWVAMLLGRLCKGTEMESAHWVAGAPVRVVCAWLRDTGESAAVRVLQAYHAGQCWREDIATQSLNRDARIDSRIAYALLRERREHLASQARGEQRISTIWRVLDEVLGDAPGAPGVSPAVLMLEKIRSMQEAAGDDLMTADG